jgi:hypothetical protein
MLKSRNKILGVMAIVAMALGITIMLIDAKLLAANQSPVKISSKCNSAEHRAFDFWLGEWVVTTPNNPKMKARSSITLGYGGCAIHENYRTESGFAGKSINFYDAKKKQWHQTWIDNQGSPLFLNGNVADGKMVLANNANRISWSTLEDGRVRQLWEMTKDQGKTWAVIFDGYYSKFTGSN